MNETPYIETEAIIYILSGDINGLRDYLNTNFTEWELKQYEQAVEVLLDVIGEELDKN